MSINIQSDSAYLGAATLSALSGTEITAASYTARVVADGGQIVNSSKLTDLFTFLAANGISARNWIFGAYFGVRLVGSKVDKIYALNGNDLLKNTAANDTLERWRYDSTGSFPVFMVNATAPGITGDIMKAQGLQYLMRAGHTSYVAAASHVNMVANDGQFSYPISCQVPGGLSVHPFAIEGFNTDGGLNRFRIAVPNGLFDPTSSTAHTQNFDGGSPYTDWAGLAAFMDVANGQVTTYSNNALVVGPTNLDLIGFTLSSGLWNPSSTLVQFYMGGVQDAATTVRPNKQKVAEVWHVSGGTTAQALAISNRLHTLYF